MAYRTVTMIQCPRCSVTLGSADRDNYRNQHAVGPPVWVCSKCKRDVLIPSHISNRDDEWEMKSTAARDKALTRLEHEDPVSSDERYWVGGCLGVLTSIAFLGIALAFGVRALFEQKALLKGAVGVGVAVAVALIVWWPMHEKKRNRNAHIRLVEDLISRIEASRVRMADPAYRGRLRAVGLDVRGLDQTTEPPEVAQFVQVLRAKVESLKTASLD